MKNFSLYIFTSIILAFGASCSVFSGRPEEKIVIEAEISDPDVYETILKKKQTVLGYKPLNSKDYTKKFNGLTAKKGKNKLVWILYSKEPLTMFCRFGQFPMVLPGDSIHIKYSNEQKILSGRGAEKIILWEQITQAGTKAPIPTENNKTIRSIPDYLNWNAYVDTKLSIQMSILESQKHSIRPQEYDWLKCNTIAYAENDRIHAFVGLTYGLQEKRLAGVQFSDLCKIFDSTQYKPLNLWFRSQSEYYDIIRPVYLFNRMEVQRQSNFDVSIDPDDTDKAIRYAYYHNAKNKYSGLMRERLLCSILRHYTAQKSNLETEAIQSMLKDYYSQTGFPQYKDWVKKSEKK